MYFVLIGQTVYAKCFIHHFDIEYIIIIRWWFRCGSRMAHVSSRPREPRCDAIRIKSIGRRNIFILKRLDCGFYGFYWMHHAIVELLCHANHKKGDGRDVDDDDYDDDEKMDYKMIQSHGDNGRFVKMAVCVCNLINDSWKNREHERSAHAMMEWPANWILHIHGPKNSIHRRKEQTMKSVICRCFVIIFNNFCWKKANLYQSPISLIDSFGIFHSSIDRIFLLSKMEVKIFDAMQWHFAFENRTKKLIVRDA